MLSLPSEWHGGLPPSRHAEFLARYWQQRPLLIRGLLTVEELPRYCPLTPLDLRALACDPDASARLIRESGGTCEWECRRGPFDAMDFEALGGRPEDPNWTLLVNRVDRALEDVERLRERFTLVPRWRVDDVMVSHAPPGGSVGAHVDNYDVILLQGRGTRSWHVEGSARSADDEEWVPLSPTRRLRRFAPSISAEELETGRGISLTYSSSRVHTLDVSDHVLGETHVRWAEIKVGGVEWPPRGGHAALRLGPDQILLCGGGIQRAWLPQDLGSPHEEDLDDCYVLRKKEDGDVGEDAPSWELAALERRLPSPRGGHVAALVPLRDARGAWDLGVLVFGGRDFHAESGTHKGRDDGVLFSLLSDDDRRHAPPPSP